METQSTISLPAPGGEDFDLLPIADGVDTRCLRPGDLLSIRTLNSVYTLRFDEPARGRVMASGDGEFINEAAPAALIGSTLSGRGSMVKIGWVLLGFKIVLAIPEGELMTSRVRGIAINGLAVAPVAPGTH